MNKRPRKVSPPAPTSSSPAPPSSTPPTASPPPWPGCARTLIQLPPPQLHIALATLAILFLEHRDRTDVAPIVDLEAALIRNFDHANHLHGRRLAVAPNQQLDFHRPQSFVAAKRAGPHIFQ